MPVDVYSVEAEFTAQLSYALNGWMGFWGPQKTASATGLL